jgi:simple sugar transport system ATP-binding protein
MANNVISVRSVSKSFAGVHALRDINLEILPGEIHCLAGENGSGKSTLIKIISGVYEPDAGTIELNGKAHTRLTPIEAILNGVQVIYQDFSVFPNLTVMENLALNTELANKKKIVSWGRFRRIAQQAVAKINFKVDLDQLVGRLSVADRQLVAITRALMGEPKLIIMDEPTTALTKKEVDGLFRIILDLKARGISTLFVSHKLEEVFEISERFTILRNGETVITCLPQELDRKSFTRHMTGRDFDEAPFTFPATEAEPILEVEDLGVDGAFSHVNFSLRRGEILGITGLLGSGRTELALTLFGGYKSDSGEIRIAGKPVKLHSIRDAIANGIGYVPEDRLTEGLFMDRSIGDNIIISEINNLISRMGWLKQSEKRKQEAEWVEKLKIVPSDPENAANTLSGGNQQRIVLAKWLATNPDILILNGPTVGVDIGSKHDIHLILRELAAKGMAIIIISDDIPEVLQNCNRVLLMKSGRIEREIDPATTTEAVLAHFMTDEAPPEGEH